MLAKQISFFGQPAILICDKKCDQAWGISRRPRVEVEGRMFYITDGEQQAPDEPGTYEGSQTKPTHSADSFKLNRSCARECERSVLAEPGKEFQLADWSQPVEVK